MSSPHEFAPLRSTISRGPRTNTYLGSAWSCTVRLVVTDPRTLPAATAELTALLDQVDAAASRFRADSALSRANRNAGRPTPVPALLVDLVDAALDAAAQTAGAVDPTLGLAMHRIGYDRDIAAVQDSSDALRPASRPGAWRQVRLHREVGLLTVPVGSALDLGATAKAWTADRAAQRIARRYRTGVLVELGGDVAVAGPCPDGWLVRVAEREGATGQMITLRHGGLATSTTTVRRWRRDGQSMHHIVDPDTGLPAAGPWRTATVAAPLTLAANVASTAAIVRGDDALDWLARRGLAARLVGQDGSVVTTAGWPAVFPAADRSGGPEAAGSGEKQARTAVAA